MIRTAITASLLFLLPASLAIAQSAGPIKAPATPPLVGTWTTTFEDNFEGLILDSTKWKVGQHWAGINGGAQPHPDNMSVENGKLRLKWDKKPTPFNFGAKKDRVYGTGEVTTYKRFSQQYGYLECRMRYDVLRTCWPAVWTMPANRPTENVNEMKWGYLKFDLAALPATARKAVLKLKIKSAPSGTYWFDIYRCLDDSWSQSKITWQNKPVFDAIFLAHVNPAPAVGQWAEVDVTKFVKQELAGDRKATFVVAEVLQQKWNTAFYSSEAAEADRPRLEIDGRNVLATEDSTVYAAKPDTNFGAESELAIFDGYGYISTTGGQGMEIDIMEALGVWGSGRLSHAVHWDGYGDDHKNIGHPVKDLPGLDLSQWTTFGLYWEEGKLEFYVNGKNTWTHTSPRVCAVPSFILLSAQTGGWDKNSEQRETVFEPNLPKYMEVDYVKMWSGTKAK